MCTVGSDGVYATGMLTSKMTTGDEIRGIASGSGIWVFSNQMYPRLKGNDMWDTDVAKLYATPIFLDSSNTVDMVTRNFTVSIAYGVNWTSDNTDSISIDRTNATVLEDDADGLNLTATLNSISRTVKLNRVASKCTIKFKAGNGGNFDDITKKVDIGYTISAEDIPELLANEGYYFTKWTPTNPLGKTVSSNVEYTANFSNQYTVTYNQGTNGTISDENKTEIVEYKQSPTNIPTVTPNEEYKFVGWTKDGKDVTPSTVQITKDTIFNAKYTTVDLDNDGIPDVDDPDDDDDGIPDGKDDHPKDHDNDGTDDKDDPDDDDDGIDDDKDKHPKDHHNDGADDKDDSDDDDDGIDDDKDKHPKDDDNDGIEDKKDKHRKDHDNDGTEDVNDPDDDNDGIDDDKDKHPKDHDNDGEDDADDPDDDNDGINDDKDDRPRDHDNDGTDDKEDPDDDNDGIDDSEDRYPNDDDNDGIDDDEDDHPKDHDNDGIDDADDPDDDNDGINDDEDDRPKDHDNDGIDDADDPDDDNDGINDDEDDHPKDHDNDGADDKDDPDDDNDGIDDSDDEYPNDDDNDGIEDKEDKHHKDHDNDGKKDNEDDDDDNDGIPDKEDDHPKDHDNDGTDDGKDPDDDNDGIADTEDEYPKDDDNDGISDAEDKHPKDHDNDGKKDNEDEDDDNDGISDEEDDHPKDHDNDGTDDAQDADDDNDGIADTEDEYPKDDDNDGISDAEDKHRKDHDNDGTKDEEDEDDDNDGIPDKEDDHPKDHDNDGTDDGKDPDDDNDGIADTEDEYPKDDDNDGISDAEDKHHKDHDNDGISDSEDDDDDNDGISDEEDDYPKDHDNDGTDDGKDPDDDNDGIADTEDEYPKDDDNDGISDAEDKHRKDHDNDGISDSEDEDDDNDGISDEEDDHPKDHDNDGTDDAKDPDDDNDGIKDTEDEYPKDDDNDGISDSEDKHRKDHDNDGISDSEDSDDDNDGISDEEDDHPKDHDNDGTDDAKDPDDDNDGIADTDDEYPNDDDNDGIPDKEDEYPKDHDNDGIEDAKDPDDDNDGINDDEDEHPKDHDNDGIEDAKDPDDDNDGIPDEEEFEIGGSVVDNNNNPVNNAHVVLKQGKHVIRETNTDTNGNYRFIDLKKGVYNLVITRGEKTVTSLIIIQKRNVTKNVSLPNTNKDSILEVTGDETPEVVVGGLDEVAEGSSEPKVVIKMTVEKKEEKKAPNAADIKKVAKGKQLDFLDMKVIKTINDTSELQSEVGKVLEIVIPYDFKDKSDVKVYRYHEKAVNTFIKREAKPTAPYSDGTYYLDEVNGFIYVYAKKFSTYAIGYKTAGKTITFNANGGTISSTTMLTGTDGKFGTIPTPTRSGGYDFDGWYTKLNGGTKITKDTVFTENTTIYAHWTYRSSSSSGGGHSSNKYYDIPLTVKGEGTITPDGGSNHILRIRKGNDQTFTIKAKKGYEISDVLVDGKSVGSVDKYTLKNIRNDHRIKVLFKEETNIKVEKPFTDVSEQDWFYDEVLMVHEKGIMSGTSDTKFSPYIGTSRAMIATILYRLENKPSYSKNNPFIDVLENEWYTDGIAWGAEHRIVKGYGEGIFKPDQIVTREELCAILSRYVKYKGLDLKQKSELTEFVDENQIADWAKETVRFTVKVELMHGNAQNQFQPKKQATRAEVATVICNLLRLLKY
jgi:uncharacterized repeat protein (TIGR02543 family)